MFLENEQTELQELESKLKKIIRADTDVTLVLKGDEHVPHGSVVELMDVANRVGVKKIMITVKRK